MVKKVQKSCSVLWLKRKTFQAASDAATRTFCSIVTCLFIMSVLSISEGGAVPRPGEPIGPQKQNLSVFGRWVDDFCTILATTQPQIAERAGMNMSTVSRVTRDVSPSEATVIKLWDAFQSLAEERGVPLSQAEKTGFYNAGGFSTQSQIETSLLALEAFKERYQQIQELKQQLEEKERIIEQLRQENKRS